MGDEKELEALVDKSEALEAQVTAAVGHLLKDSMLPWQERSYIRFGKLILFRFADRTLSIGPHWFFALFVFGTILMVGGGFILFIAPTMHLFFRLGSATATATATAIAVIATAGCNLTLLLCALSDPGLLQPMPCGSGKDKDILTLLESTASKWTPEIKRQRQRYSSNGEDLCTICNIIQPKGARHCEWCHVCVAGYDHHCPWVGKCVGSENLKAFYAFLTVSLTSLFFMVASTLVFSP